MLILTLFIIDITICNEDIKYIANYYMYVKYNIISMI